MNPSTRAAVRVNDVTRSICSRDTAVAPRPTRRAELTIDDLPVFHALKFSVCFTERNSAFDIARRIQNANLP